MVYQVTVKVSPSVRIARQIRELSLLSFSSVAFSHDRDA